MKISQSTIAYTVLIVITLVVGAGSYWLYSWGTYRDNKEMRDILMVDTEARMTQHKSNVYYNTKGLMHDVKTGNLFYDDIDDKLYVQYAKDHKNIELRYPVSVDQLNQTSIGVFAIILSFVGALLTAYLIFAMSCASYIEIRATYFTKSED